MQHFEKQRRSEKKCQTVEEVDNVVQICRFQEDLNPFVLFPLLQDSIWEDLPAKVRVDTLDNLWTKQSGRDIQFTSANSGSFCQYDPDDAPAHEKDHD